MATRKATQQQTHRNRAGGIKTTKKTDSQGKVKTITEYKQYKHNKSK